jgi:voltage-gated potassium channel
MRRLFSIIALLLSLTLVGTLGLRLIEGARWFDCLYMAILTLTTVGYSEVIPLSDAGRAFIIVYLIGGLGTFTYSAFQLGQWIASAQVRSLLERRRMEKAIAKLDDHFIVCGMGRMGRTICDYFAERGRPFVVVDHDEEAAAACCEENGWLYVLGDATDDNTLVRAGIERARALTSVLSTDADNVYVVLSARMLNAKLQIVARAGEEKAIEKIERAGATRVVSPFSSGAVKMARFMLNPSIEDFLEIADDRGNELELADVQIDANSPYVGKPLAETDLRDKGVMVIGIRRANGERLMPPPGSTVLHSGDSLFAFGSAESVNTMIGDNGPTDS